jgi:hypothetical protein
MNITNNLLGRFAALAAATWMLTLTMGCADIQGALVETSAWRDKAKLVQMDVHTQLEMLKDQQHLLDEQSQDTTIIDAAIARAQAQIELLDAAIMSADLVIEEATNPSDSLTQAAHSLSSWIPAPAQGPLVLGAALVATILRSRNLKNSAQSIIQSIEHTLNRDPEFKELFANHSDTIRTIQTPSARKLIDSTVNKSSKKLLGSVL